MENQRADQYDVIAVLDTDGLKDRILLCQPGGLE